MTQATITVTVPEQVWVSQISRNHPDAVVRVLAAVPDGRSGFALVKITGPDVPAVVSEMDEHPQLTELSPIQWRDGEATVHFETTAPLLLFSARESGIPIELPVAIRNGEATITVAGARERLSAFTTQLEEFGFEYRIEQVGQRHHERQPLSDRQLEVVTTAVEQGYYDTPRRCSLTDLADHLGIAKSTCSETLHRAEETIVKRFVEDCSGLDETDALGENPLER